MPSAALIGRERDLATLDALWRDALGGAAAIVVIRGEAGIGKTRLATEVVQRAARDSAAVLQGGCAPILGSSVLLGPVRDLFRGAPAAVPADRPQAIAPLEHATSLLSTGSETLDRGVLFGALTDAVLSLAPALLVLEDVHWADPMTLAWLAALDRVLRVTRPPMLLVVTCRPEDAESTAREWLAEQVRSPLTVLIEPARLTTAQTADLLAQRAGAPLERTSIAAITSRSDGIPFHIEELASDPTGPVPAGLRDAMGRRLERLPSMARVVVDAAAVLGRRCSHGLLAATTNLADSELADGIRSAVSGGVLVTDGDGYRFRHALLADHAYNELLPGDRVRLHRIAATVLEASASADPGEIARHYQAAGRPTETFAWAIRAAQRATALDAHIDARRWYETCVALWDEGLVSRASALIGRAELLVECAETLHRSGDSRAAIGHLERALTELAGSGDPAGTAQVLAKIGRAQMWLGRARAGYESCRRAFDMVADLPLDARTVEVRLWLAHTLLLIGKPAEGLRVTAPALEWARAADDRELLADAVVVTGSGLAAYGRIRDARQWLMDNEAPGDWPWRPRARQAAMRAWIHVWNGEPQRALALLRSLIGEAGIIDRTSDIVFASLIGISARVAFLIGDWQLADQLLHDAALGGAMADDIGIRCSQIPLLLGRGDYAGAESLLREFAPTLLTRGTDDAPTTRCWLVSAALARDDFAGACTTAIDGLREVLGTSDEMFAGELLVIGLRACADAAEKARARRDDAGLGSALRAATTMRELGEAMPWGPLGVHPNFEYASTLALRHQALAELARAAHVPGPDAWRAAADAWAGIPVPLERAYCLWRAAEAAAALGDRQGITPLLTDASAIAVRLGAVPLQHEIDDLARRLRMAVSLVPPELVPTRAASHPYGLTEREHEVLMLMADGLTNAEIAQRLFISPRTVGVHVGHILDKMNVPSRVQAAVTARHLQAPV